MKNVWGEFKCATLGDYVDVYMVADVLLLSAAFEAFRDVCHEIYKLDPLWYITTPSLAFDAMLKKTNVRLELFTNPDDYAFTEREIRGGMCQVTKRYARANNPYMDEGFDPAKAHIYLIYLDVNNLYGIAMRF